MTPLPGGAERKLVSVLAAEVDERVEEFAERDPEDVRAVQARHLGRVRAEVERFGGAVEHVIGGRSLAVFGSPEPMRTTRNGPCGPRWRSATPPPAPGPMPAPRWSRARRWCSLPAATVAGGRSRGAR